jgi:MFS family permease
LPINGFNNIWLQKYYIEIRGLNQLMATISVVFTSGAEFLGLVLGSKITDKFSEKTPGKRLFIGFIAALIAAPLFLIPFLLIWTLTAHPTIGMNFIEICWYMFISAMKNYQIFLSYILLFFGFFFLAFIGPIIIPALSDFNQSEHKNLAINFCLVIYYFSWVISPILGGIIGDRFSLKHIFLLAPFIYAIVSLLFLVAYRITLRNGLL